MIHRISFLVRRGVRPSDDRVPFPHEVPVCFARNLLICIFGVLGVARIAIERDDDFAAAALCVISQFMVVQAYPFWSLICVALAVLVIYALAAYGGKPDTA